MQEARSKNRSDAKNALDPGINKPLMNDRRYSPRLTQRLPIEVCGESLFNPHIFRGRTCDIAAKGIYFVCEEAYMVGQLIHVTVTLSGDRAVSCDSVSLTLRYRIQRVETLIRNGLKIFGVAVALDE
jgi:hypothetical protein